jgi:TP901 family phage tail tape measure protein
MPGPARTVTITGFGDFRDLQAELERTGIVADTSTKKIVTSAAGAGRAAADQAKAMGASADEQTAAAGRAAAAYVDSSGEITKAQKAAASAAAEAARIMGASADQQVAASRRALEAARVTGGGIGRAFEDGTSRAGNALTKFGATGASWGIPFAGSLSKIGKQFDEAETKGQKMTSVLSSVGKLTLGVGAVGGIAAGVESVKSASALEKQMEMIHTQAHASQAEVKSMTKAVMEMGASVGTGPQQLAEGLYHVESVGKHGAEALKVLRTGAEGAQIGNANLVDVMNALDATVISGMPGVKNYKAAMGDLNATVGAGDMKMQDLADALGTGLLANVRQADPSLKDVSAALAVFGDNNLRGAEAATKLSSALRIMAAPSKAAAEALHAVGIAPTQLAHDLQHGGLVTALSDLKKHLTDSGATAEQTELVLARAFGGRQSTGVKILLEQLDRLKEKEKAVSQGSGSFGADWQGRTKTLSYQMDQLKAEVQSVGDKLGMALIPKLQEAGHALSDMIGWMEKHKAVAEDLGHIIEGVLGLAVAVFAEQTAVKFGKGVASMVGDMGKLVTSLASGTDQLVGLFTGQGAASTAAAAEVEANSAATAAAVQAEAARVGGANAAMDASFAELGPAAVSGTATVDTAVAGMAEDTVAAAGTMDAALSSTGVGAVLVGLGIAGFELEQHWSEAMSAMESATAKAANVMIDGLNEVKTIVEDTSSLGIIPLLQATGVIHGSVVPDLPHVGEPGGSHSSGSNVAAEEQDRAMGGQWVTSKNGATPAARSITSLHNLGLNSLAAQGVVKALMAETNENLEKGAGEEGREGAFGIAQWLGSRRTGLEAYAKSQHKPKSNLEVQLEYLAKELKGPERATLQALTHAHGVNEASGIFIKSFERPEVPSAVEDRAAAIHAGGLSQKALEELGVDEKKKKTAAALGVPAGVATMLATAKALVGTRYTHGGGHDGWDPVEALKKIGVDCSGFVSQVLHTGGVLSNPLTTSGLPGSPGIASGAGKYVTIYDRPSGSQAHELIDILGKYFESGGNPKDNPKGGVSLLTAAQAKGELAGGGFEAFHPTALNKAVRGGVEAGSLVKGLAPQEAEAAAFAAQIKKREKELESAGGKELSKLTSATSSGNISGLQQVLGARTAGGAAASAPAKAYDQLLASLKAMGDTSLVTQLVAAHKSAMVTIAAQLKAVAKETANQQIQNADTEEKDRTTIAADAASRQLQIVKDQQTAQTDALQAAATSIDDASGVMRAEMEAAASALADALQTSSDTVGGEVQQIRDRSAIEVDTLSERGLYGLNLVAQKEQVQLDQMRLSYDIQINQAQIALDQAKAAQDSVVAQDKTNEALLQAHEDAVIAQDQAHADATQLASDMRIATAAAAVSTAQLASDMGIDSAKLAVILAAGGTKAQQNMAHNLLAESEVMGARGIDAASSALSGVEAQANSAIQAATAALEGAKGEAAIAIAEANRAVAAAEAAGAKTLGAAEEGLQKVKGEAERGEATAEAEIDKTKAEASTQFAGSGTVINIEGVNPTDAQAIASEVNWAMLTRVPATR